MELLVTRQVVNPELQGKLVRVQGRVYGDPVSVLGVVSQVDNDSFQVSHASSNKTTMFLIKDFEMKRLSIVLYVEDRNVTINLQDQKVK